MNRAQRRAAKKRTKKQKDQRIFWDRERKEPTGLVVKGKK